MTSPATAGGSGDPRAVDGVHDSDVTAEVLRPGRDAVVLLVLWCVRRASVALFGIGLCFAGLHGAMNDLQWATLNSPRQVLRNLTTPLVGVALAVVIRFLARTAAGLAALPLAVREFRARRAAPGVPAFWADLYYLMSAYRSMRWSRAVLELAVSRTGTPGRILLVTAQVLFGLSIASFVALPVVVVLLVR